MRFRAECARWVATASDEATEEELYAWADANLGKRPPSSVYGRELMRALVESPKRPKPPEG